MIVPELQLSSLSDVLNSGEPMAVPINDWRENA